jgi:phosphoglycolate phosphatase-like HAD superfamily hydrolase
MIKPVLLDVDGVLLDYSEALHRFWAAHCPHIGQPDHLDEHVFELTGRYKISREEANQLLWDFHHHAMFADMNPLPGAQKAVAKLAEFHPLVCITACGSDPDTQLMRRENLLKVFGDVFDNVYCTDTFAEKSQYLNQYDTGYWVEDHIKNALLGLDAGHTCFLIDAPYNEGEFHPSIIRVVSCLDAAIQILGLDTQSSLEPARSTFQK